MKATLTWTFLTTIFGMTINIRPNIPFLLVAMVVAMGLDFLTGIIKAKIHKIARTSEGYRLTVKKTVQYFSAAGLCLGLNYLVKTVIAEKTEAMLYINMFVLCFIIYIEITSILENLYQIDHKSKFSKFMIRPLLSIMKLGLEKNSVVKAAEKMQSGEKPVDLFN